MPDHVSDNLEKLYMKQKAKHLISLCCIVGLLLAHVQDANASCVISDDNVAATASDATQTQYSLVLWMYDGSKIFFSVDDYPKVTHVNGEVIMTTTKGSFTYSDSTVWKFTISKETGENTSVENISSSLSSWHKAGDVIRFASATPGSQVHIYTLSGMLLKSYTIGSDGKLSISLSSYEQGIYVIKTKETTIKIAKR